MQKILKLYKQTGKNQWRSWMTDASSEGSSSRHGVSAKPQDAAGWK